MTTQVRRPRRAAPAALVPPPQRRFTVDEYYRMAEAGIFRRDEHVELLEGVIFSMCAIGSWHAATVGKSDRWFSRQLGDRAIVRIQNPVQLGPGSEPEPDVAIVRYRDDDYVSAHPGPGDVYLLIEVADTSIGYDRDWKLPIYAAAGVPEVWIADLNGDRMLTFSDPVAGRYTRAEVVGRGDVLKPGAFPDLTLPVADVLPTRPVD
ncbi:MAG: Uma2 family endonuclease [Dehalococcoidia bacterium]